MKPRRSSLAVLLAFTALALTAFAGGPRHEKPEFIGGPLPRFNPDTETKTGKIVLAAHVDEEGYVQHVEVRSTTNETLIRPCTVALLAWRFAPAKANGAAVPCIVLQRFNFDDEVQRDR